jgi:hypothetical protein
MFKSVKDDGGVRDVTAAGGERESAIGKGRFDLLPPTALLRLAQHYENGARKYAPRNWEKGLPLSRFIDSAFRHLVQFMDGDREEDHLAAVLWNIAGYIQTEEWIRRGCLPAVLNDTPWEDSVPKEEKSNAVARRHDRRVGKAGG